MPRRTILDRLGPAEPGPEPRPRPGAPARAMTPGQRWRARRDLVIHVASGAGVSQRMLADVFDLPRSRVAKILKATRRGYGKKAGLAGPIADEPLAPTSLATPE